MSEVKKESPVRSDLTPKYGTIETWCALSGMGRRATYDALDLICHLRTSNRKEAWHWAVEWLGHKAHVHAPMAREPHQKTQQRQGTALARTIWAEATPPRGSLVEAYLASRGLLLQPRAPLRFHPACPRGADRLPAMVALLTDPVSAEPCGVHRTFLLPDGSRKADVAPAKMMLGRAGIIRLSLDDEVTAGLGICEGIENGLAVLQHVGWAPVWAAGSAGAITRFPVLPGIECLTIFADADDKGAGLTAAQACGARWNAAGRKVIIQRPPAGTDWLDALEKQG